MNLNKVQICAFQLLGTVSRCAAAEPLCQQELVEQL